MVRPATPTASRGSSARPTRYAHTAWYLCQPSKGALVSVPSECPVDHVVEYDVFGRVGASYEGPAASAHSVQRFVVRQDVPEAADVFARVEESCERSNVWDGP